MILDLIKSHFAEVAKFKRAAATATAAAEAGERIVSALVEKLNDEEKKVHDAFVKEFEKNQAAQK